MGGAHAVRALLTVVTTIIVARIISPSDYGVLAMAAPILAFVQLFQDMGFSAATIQAKEVRPDHSSTLFWVNVAVSLFVAAVLVGFAPVVADFYGDPRVGEVTAALAALALLSGIAMQHTALLTRQMRYRSIATITLSGAVATAGATIILAYYLSNYWALFLGTLAGAIVQTALTWQCSSWRPGARASWHETRALMHFGGYVATFNLVNFFSRNADNILIGRFWGATQLGLYDRSYKLMLTPIRLVNSPLASVVLPVLSRLRDEPQRYRAAYLFNLRALLLVIVPAAALAASASEQVILLLLGPAWSEAAPIFFWLALATLYQPIGNSTGWLFLSSGQAKAYAGWGMASAVVVVASFVIGLPWGAMGVAAAYVIGGVLRLPFLLHWATKNTSVRATDIVTALLPFVIAALGTWVLTSLLKTMLTPLPLVLAGLASSYLLLLAVLFAIPDGRAFLHKLVELGKALRRGQTVEQSEMLL